MDLGEALVRLGTEAVLQYRAICLPDADNEVPELFIGGFLRSRLRREYNVRARTEFAYLEIAEKHLQVGKTPLLVRQMGGWRADVALFPEGRPPVVTELKILDGYLNEALAKGWI